MHGTHKNTYSTHLLNWDEKSYEIWHDSLGEKLVEQATTSITTTKNAIQQTNNRPYSPHELQSALRSIIGISRWKNDSQKKMVDLQCNSMHRHKYYHLPCGGGKFMAALVPLVVAHRCGREKRRIVYVSPYSFLLGSQVKKAKDALKKSGIFTPNIIASYNGMHITENDLPTELCIHHDGYIPELLFFNVRAFSNLLQYNITSLNLKN